MVLSGPNGVHKLAADSWIANVSNAYFKFQHFLLATIRIHGLALNYIGDSLRIQGSAKQKIHSDYHIPLYRPLKNAFFLLWTNLSTLQKNPKKNRRLAPKHRHYIRKQKYSQIVNMSVLAIFLKLPASPFLCWQRRGKPALDFESDEGYVYNLFEAVVDVVHGKKRKKLAFAKCTKCGRLSPFRPKSKGMQFTALYCNSCGNLISFGTIGRNPQISELAEIFCENCEEDCRKCQISKLANEKSYAKTLNLGKRAR